jgi:hypothetical protein
MPKEKELTKLIPRIYKYNTENLMLFCWVNSQRQVIPTITVTQAINNYFSYADIDDWDIESARTIYERMQKEFHEDCKS